MSSRDKILAAVKKNQPAIVELPALDFSVSTYVDLKDQFIKTLTGIGGSVIEVNELKEIGKYIKSTFPEPARIVNTSPDLNFEPAYPADRFEILNLKSVPHDFSNVTVAIINGEFGVAENGAIWLTDTNMGDQALPYISEHLVLVINKNSIVPTLHAHGGHRPSCT